MPLKITRAEEEEPEVAAMAVDMGALVDAVLAAATEEVETADSVMETVVTRTNSSSTTMGKQEISTAMSTGT
jgi:hypothetical protein